VQTHVPPFPPWRRSALAGWEATMQDARGDTCGEWTVAAKEQSVCVTGQDSVAANRYIEAFVLGRLCKRIPPD